METTLTESEEKVLVGTLYNQVSFGTTMEVFGELTADGIKRIDTQRIILEKLFKKYNLVESLSQEDYLILGLVNFLKKESLEAWVGNDKNKHLQLRANYFKSKKSV